MIITQHPQTRMSCPVSSLSRGAVRQDCYIDHIEQQDRPPINSVKSAFTLPPVTYEGPQRFRPAASDQAPMNKNSGKSQLCDALEATSRPTHSWIHLPWPPYDTVERAQRAERRRHRSSQTMEHIDLSLEQAIARIAIPGVLIGHRLISEGDERGLTPEDAEFFANSVLERRRASGAARIIARELLA